MAYVAQDAVAPSTTRPRAAAHVLDGAILVALAAGIAVLERSSGGYDPRTWTLAGVAILLACGALLVLGLRPARTAIVACGLLLLLGGWSIWSTAWGGLPDQAWRFSAQLLIAAAALALGCMLAASGRARLVLAAVLVGITANALELLLTPVLGSVETSWFNVRAMQGTVGYHNAQAALMAVGLGLALWGIGSERAWWRAASGLAGTVVAATILLTQSRAGLGTAAVCLVVTLAWARDARLFLRSLPLVGAAALFAFELQDVDRALVEGVGVDAALQTYAAWALAAGLLVAGLVIPPIPFVRARRIATAAVVVLALGVVTPVAVSQLRSADLSGAAFTDADPNKTAPGETRLVSLSLNGRRDAWRVAVDEGRSDPLRGTGQGTFPIAWAENRRLDQLSILQPHSIGLELFAELGLVGVALFGAALLAVMLGVVRQPERRLAATALGVLVAFAAQAFLDWTWSFVGLVAVVLLVAGAAISGRAGPSPGTVGTVGGALALGLAVLFVGVYGQADRDLRHGRSLVATDPVAATEAFTAARRWNRWDPEPVELLGRLAERGGNPSEAAGLYARAATLSQFPWLQHFREARAARAAGDAERRTAACARATDENPAEIRLRDAIC